MARSNLHHRVSAIANLHQAKENPERRDRDMLEGEDEVEYDPDAYYTWSTNNKGFSKKVSCSFDPGWVGQIGGLIASRKLADYETMQDFVRNAVYHQLMKDMQAHGTPEDVEYLRVMGMRERLARNRRRREEWDKIVEELEADIRSCEAKKDARELQRLIEYMESLLPTMHPPHKESVEIMLARCKGHLF